MLNNIFNSIIDGNAVTVSTFIWSTLCSLLCGLFIAVLYMIRTRSSQSFLITLVLLPAIVQIVIMLVNGNIGAGVAVAGAFSLVRFRSAPGRGQEITSIFLVMAVGLATGMGYLGIAVIFTVLISVINLILSLINFGHKDGSARILKITVPENLDFEGKFEPVFKEYLSRFELIDVKTAEMGTVYKLSYEVTTSPDRSVKEMIDRLRETNGNLEISLGRPVSRQDEL